MEVSATQALPADAEADTVVVGLFEGEGIAHDVDGVLQGRVDAGEARAKPKHLAVAHAGGRRWILVGLGARDAFEPERAREAAAVAHGRARELGAERLCWEVPHKVDDAIPGALVEGTVLSAYRFDRFKTRPADDEAGAGPAALIVSAHHDVAGPVERARVVTEAANRARDLQNAPPNDLTPTRFGAVAQELAGDLEGVEVAVEGREGIVARGMGCFAAVAQGSAEEPALITLRYDGAGAGGPPLGLVGKAVTFDSGGISLKPAAKMSEMKFDMSGGAAVLGAVAAIARLRLPVPVVAVIGATENLPSQSALKPGDVVRALDGTTVEIINTDAEGRLVLADCLTHAVREGAARLVDVATLTGAIVTALGSTYCGLFANDDPWAGAVTAAGAASGERAWRLPVDRQHTELLESATADVANLHENRKAGSSVAAAFLQRFAGDVPWAHLDIAGVAWDLGRPYASKGGSGFGVRLLVELAQAEAARA